MNNPRQQQNQRGGHQNRPQEPKEFDEKVVQVNRVSKKTKGGNQMGFSVLTVVGDKKGRVGVALGKAPDVLSSIQKGVRKAKKRLIRVPLKGTTIPFAIHIKYGAARIMLKPAPKGSGIIAGGAMRSVVEAAGITDIVGKILGSNNKANNVYATFKALDHIRTLVKVKGINLEPKKKIIVAEAKPAVKPEPKKLSTVAKESAKPRSGGATKKTVAKKSSTKKAK